MKKRKIVRFQGDYLIIYKPNHHQHNCRGYVRLHRWIYEYYHKYCLLSWIDIHHINGKKTDNQKHNIIPLLPSKHTKETLKSYWKRIRDKTNNRICILCGTDKTNIKKNNGKHWYSYKNGFVCKRCYNKIIYKNKIENENKFIKIKNKNI